MNDLKLFHNTKKSQLVLKPMIELLVAVAILLIFLYVGKSYGAGEVFQKIRIVEDDTSTINILHSLPDNAYIFNHDLSKFSISFDKTSETVSSVVNDPTQAKRFFVKTNCPEYNLNFKNPELLIFQKSGNCVEISDKKLPTKQRCPAITFARPSKIIIMPKTQQENIYQFTEALAASITNSKTKDWQELDTEELILEIIPMQEKEIKAYFAPNLESRKLACLIANALLDKNPDIIIIPSEKPQLSKAQIAVSLEIPEEFETSDTIEAISKALK